MAEQDWYYAAPGDEAPHLSAMILGIGYQMAGWTQQKQALHDMIARTLVVRKTERPL